jgi:hypothetical protein
MAVVLGESEVLRAHFVRFEHARHALIQSLMVLVGELVVPVCAFG